jgi:hypothetical protein
MGDRRFQWERALLGICFWSIEIVFCTIGFVLKSRDGTEFTGIAPGILTPSMKLQLLRVCFSTPSKYAYVEHAASLHGLRVPERITFKVAVLTYLALHGTAPRYLSSQLTRIAEASGLQHLIG